MLNNYMPRYVNDPNSVDEAWRAFFQDMDDDQMAVSAKAAGPSWSRNDWPPVPGDDLTAALDGQWPAEDAKSIEKKIVAKSADKGESISSEQLQQAVQDSVPRLYHHCVLTASEGIWRPKLIP